MVFWKQSDDFCCRLVTHDGEPTLDDDALGGFWDGVVEEKRKGREGE